MQRGLFNAALLKLEHDRLDFVFEENEIAHQDGAATDALESEPGSESERGLDGHTLHCDMHIGARKPEFVYVSGQSSSMTAQRVFHALPRGGVVGLGKSEGGGKDDE
jgi:hypothetical protein